MTTTEHQMTTAYVVVFVLDIHFRVLMLSNFVYDLTYFNCLCITGESYKDIWWVVDGSDGGRFAPNVISNPVVGIFVDMKYYWYVHFLKINCS